MQDQQDVPYQAKTNTLAILSLVSGTLSIFSLPAYFCMPCLTVLGVIFGALGIILATVSKKKIRESQGSEIGSRLATGGLVMGLVGSIVSLIALIITLLTVGLILGVGLSYPSWIENLP